MTERPIIFSAPMVRAILDGRKCQTRRIIKPQPADDVKRHILPNPDSDGWISSLRHKYGSSTVHTCRYGSKGDLLYVRETFCGAKIGGYDGREAGGQFWYRATDEGQLCHETKWRPAIHMPKHAARIWLEITDVRVERLQDISDEDAIAEGVETKIAADGHTFYRDYQIDKEEAGYATARDSFLSLWAHINGATSCEANPWVWAVSFRRIEEKTQERAA